MPVIFLALLLFFASSSLSDGLGGPAQSPKVLLSSRTLRRLQRDRERQTIRWQNFETRVRGVPESPERGFELALYFAVTRDQQRGREAVAWALQHPCDRRQTALVLAWVDDLVTKEQSNKILAQSCPADKDPLARLRNNALLGLNQDNQTPALSADIKSRSLASGAELYKLVEYLFAVRFRQHEDLRDSDPEFFLDLPIRFLLSMRPQELENPSWQEHIAALAMVSLDPNLESSQFLQGWGMEERFMIQDGPGVGYEFLWADPYLPGVSYQNMEPWLYDPKGARLIARSDWSEQACWINVSSNIEEQDCPAGWQTKKITFGHLTLTPMVTQCADVANRINGEATILWKLPPNGKLAFEQDGGMKFATADANGMWRATPDVHAKVCAAAPVKEPVQNGRGVERAPQGNSASPH